MPVAASSVKARFPPSSPTFAFKSTSPSVEVSTTPAFKVNASFSTKSSRAVRLTAVVIPVPAFITVLPRRLSWALVSKVKPPSTSKTTSGAATSSRTVMFPPAARTVASPVMVSVIVTVPAPPSIEMSPPTTAAVTSMVSVPSPAVARVRAPATVTVPLTSSWSSATNVASPSLTMDPVPTARGPKSMISPSTLIPVDAVTAPKKRTSPSAPAFTSTFAPVISAKVMSSLAPPPVTTDTVPLESMAPLMLTMSAASMLTSANAVMLPAPVTSLAESAVTESPVTVPPLSVTSPVVEVMLTNPVEVMLLSTSTSLTATNVTAVGASVAPIAAPTSTSRPASAVRSNRPSTTLRTTSRPAVTFTSEPSSTSIAPSRSTSRTTVIVRFSSVSPVALMSRSFRAAKLPTESSNVTEPAPPTIVRLPAVPVSASLIVPVTRSRSAAAPPVVIVIVPPLAMTRLSSITMLPPVDVTFEVNIVRSAVTVPGPVPVSVMSSLTSTVLE